MLEQLWQGDGFRCVISIRNGRPRQFFFPTTDEAKAKAQELDAKGIDTYFAPGLTDGQGRKKANVQGAAAFWADVDCGPGKPYPNAAEALKSILVWIEAQSFHQPTIVVHSGAGLHMYWLLDRFLPRGEWERIADHFKRACLTTGFYVDASRASDIASVLRIPGTHNYKYDRKPEVKLLRNTGRRYSPEEFEKALPVVGPKRPAKANQEFELKDDYPPAHIEPIEKKCAQMAAVKAKGGLVDEPLWRAALSVLWRCEDGLSLIHSWSQGDPRYNAAETEAKARGTLGPATCAHFEGINLAACLACPVRGKFASPIVLGMEPSVVHFEGRAEDGEEKPGVERCGSFRVTETGIKEADADEDGAVLNYVQITAVPLWLLEVREKAREKLDADRSTLLLGWKDFRGETRYGVVEQAEVYEERQFVRWLANHNLIAQVFYPLRLAKYLKEATRELTQRGEVKKYYEALGWYGDEFVIGQKVVTKDGTRPALLQTSAPVAKLDQRGDAEEWVKTAGLLGKPEYWAQAFPLLAAFGSPVLHLVGHTSAVVSLVGKSGYGKTLSAFFALSLYGTHEHLFQSATATFNAFERHLAVNRHIPTLLDEVSGMRMDRLSELVYVAANGRSKDSLTRQREFRVSGLWSATTFLTTNRPLIDASEGSINEANRRRLLEIVLPGALPRKLVEALHTAVHDHPGAVAERYLKALILVKDKIPALFEVAVKRVVETCKIPDESRFQIWTLAAALVGSQIAHRAGVLPFDPEAVIWKVGETLTEQASQIDSDEVRFVDVVSDLLTRNSKWVSQWSSAKAKAAVPLQTTENPIARYDSEAALVYMMSSFLSDALREKGVSLSLLRDWMKANEITRVSVQLAPYTPAVSCLRIPATLLKFKPETHDAA